MVNTYMDLTNSMTCQLWWRWCLRPVVLVSALFLAKGRETLHTGGDSGFLGGFKVVVEAIHYLPSWYTDI